MQRIKRPPIRNKIEVADRAQIRAWTRRLRVPVDELKAIIQKVGNSVQAVTKEVELQRLGHQQPGPVPPIPSAGPSEPGAGKISDLALS
jgi:Protein of unknown function (DUF3606)